MPLECEEVLGVYASTPDRTASSPISCRTRLFRQAAADLEVMACYPASEDHLHLIAAGMLTAWQNSLCHECGPLAGFEMIT